MPLLIEGTAKNGIDYETIPDSVLIPKGQRFAYVDIIPWEDGIPEGVETAIILYNTEAFDPEATTTNFYIYDKPEFTITTPQIAPIHCRDTVMLYTIIYNGGLPPYSYYWYISESNTPFDSVAHPRVHPEEPTLYVVHQWDACGDLEVDSIFVDVLGPQAQVSADTSICLGDHAILVASGGDSYYWEPGGHTSPEIHVNPAINTTYTVTVYDACGNSDVDSVSVFVDNPQAYAGEDQYICPGEAVTLMGMGGVEYLWSTGEESQSITVKPESDECYIVYVTDACNNTVSDTVCVHVDNSLQADAGPDQQTCAGESVLLEGNGGSSCIWNTGDTTYTIEVSPEETTTFFLSVQDACQDIDSVTVTVNPIPLVEASVDNNHINTGESVQLYGSGAGSYYWSSYPEDPSLSGQETLQNPIVSPEAPLTIYTLHGTDNQSGCSNTASLNIIIVDPLSSEFTLDRPAVCTGEEAVINYFGPPIPGATYDYSFDGGIASGSGPGPYQIKWTEAGTKTLSLKVYIDGYESEVTQKTLRVIPSPEVSFSSNITEGCAPVEIDFINHSLGIVPGTEFIWNFGDGQQAYAENPVYAYDVAGEYTISLQLKNEHCKDMLSFENYISVYDKPSADFSLTPEEISANDPEITISDLSMGDPHEWIWDLGDGTIIYNEQNLSHVYESPGIFSIRLIIYNKYGCWDSLSKSIQVLAEPKFFAPNAFRPSSTIGNDRFIIRAAGVEIFNLMIFSRWGKRSSKRII
ncbi:MAG: PKD domain-containing protein [Bacteroidota bacterium]|nr:PKD domain-containing protein [Bacteroidota bacterium]